MEDTDIKQTKNLFKKFINDLNSVSYSADKISGTLSNKSTKSVYEKDKVFYNIYKVLEDKEVIWDSEKTKLPFYTPFVEQKKDIDRSSTQYSINAPLQFLHADVANIRFFSKSAVDPKYALLCVDLFPSKIYVYPMKTKSNLARKIELFYKEIEPKGQREDEKMRLQTDLKFQQNEINRLNEKYNVEMFSSKVRGGGGGAFTAKQKIREFKKLHFKSKKLDKASKTSRIDPRKLIRNAVENMIKNKSQKYGIPPEEIEEKSLATNEFREVYDFYRMVKVSKEADSYERSDIRFDKKLRAKLRSPLLVGEKVLALAERLRNKDTSGNLHKSTTENMSFFNREQIFIVRKVVPRDDSHNYWISKTEDGENIDKRFLRQELFALKNQFE